MEERKKKHENFAELQIRFENLLDKAIFEWKNSNYNKAKTFAEAALVISKSLNSIGKEAHVKHVLGTIYSYINAYDIAYEYHLQALKIHRKLKMTKQEVEDLISIGDINIKLGSYKKAEECFLESLKLHPDYERAVNNLGYIASHRKEFAKAIEYYDRAIAISQEKKNYRSYLISLINKSEAQMKKGNISAAEETIELALEKIAEFSELSTISELRIAAIMNQAIALQQRQQYQIAERKMIEALEMSEKCENPDYKQKIYKLLSEFYAENNNFEKAYNYLKKYEKFTSEYMNKKVVEKVMRIQNFYEKDKKQLTGLQLNERTARLATMGVLSAGITHEINQPLCAIKINLESILYMLKKQNVDLPFDMNIELEQIMDGVLRIEEIVKHIRSFWNYGKNDKIQDTHLDKTIEKVVSLLERQIYSHGITIIKNVEQGLSIKCASIHLEQILINIISNAINALDKVSKKKKEIEIRVKSYDGKIVVSIIDNGPGIEKKKIDNLFDPFYSTGYSKDNMGLGLAIVKYFTEHYEGTLDVTSEIDKFTRFDIEFPILEEAK